MGAVNSCCVPVIKNRTIELNVIANDNVPKNIDDDNNFKKLNLIQSTKKNLNINYNYPMSNGNILHKYRSSILSENLTTLTNTVSQFPNTPEKQNPNTKFVRATTTYIPQISSNSKHNFQCNEGGKSKLKKSFTQVNLYIDYKKMQKDKISNLTINQLSKFVKDNENNVNNSCIKLNNDNIEKEMKNNFERNKRNKKKIANSQTVDNIVSFKVKKQNKLAPPKLDVYQNLNEKENSHHLSSFDNSFDKKLTKKNIEEIEEPLNQEQIDFIIKTLKEDEMINDDMPKDLIDKIIQSIKYYKVKCNTTLCSIDKDKEGTKRKSFIGGEINSYNKSFDSVSNFSRTAIEGFKTEIDLSENKQLYIIEKGKLQMCLDGDIYTLSKGNSISIKALIKTTKHFCYLKTIKKKAHLFKLPLRIYTKIFNEYIDLEHDEKVAFLKNHFLFAKEDKKTLNLLSNRCVKKSYQTLTPLILKGDFPSCFYLIVKGEILCMKDNDDICYRLTDNQFVGGINFFLIDICSQFNFYASKGTLIYKIEHETVEEILCINNTIKNEFSPLLGNNLEFEDRTFKMIYQIFSNAVNNSRLFSKYFNQNNLMDFFKIFSIKAYENDTICSRKNKKLILPIEGYFSEIINNTTTDFKSSYVSVNNFLESNSETVHFFPNGNFYEEFLFNNPKNKTNVVTCKYSGLVLEAPWKDVLQSIISYLNKSLTLFDIIKFLKNVKFFEALSEIKLFYIAENLKFIGFKEKELIIKNGPTSDRLYIIKKGIVEMAINQVIVNELNIQSCFGDISNKKELTSENKQTTSFFAKTIVECYYLDKDIFEEIMQIEDSSSLNKNFLDNSINLKDLFYLKELGQGSYGKVHLVHDKKRLYALKTAEISSMINDKNLIMGYLNEKYLMSIINHPFIVKLIRTFKTRDFLIFLMEYVNGISLRGFLENQIQSQLRNIKLLKFLAAILCIVLNYLQRRRIIHRDLKPDNLMIDNKGYIKTIDFGVAKNMSGKDFTLSLIGTSQYMSPEVILGQKYSFSIDVWSCGVILYEILYGKIPFGFGVKEPKDIYKEIKEKKPVFPSDLNIEDANNFIRDMLDKNPTKRMNCFYKWKNYKLFMDYDLDKLIKKELESPFINIKLPSKNKNSNPNINNSSFNIIPDEPDSWSVSKTFVEYMKNNIFCTFQDIYIEVENELTEFLNDF